jgi:putative thioredoxin
MEAHARGENEAARRLLVQAIEMDPANETAQLDYIEVSLAADALDDAREVLDAIAEKARDTARVEALRARLHLSTAGGGADPAALQARIADAPDDLDARLTLANAMALDHDYRAAFEQLIEIVRRDRRWNDEAGRKAMLTLFSMLGTQPAYDDLVREFRIALARTLN